MNRRNRLTKTNKQTNKNEQVALILSDLERDIQNFKRTIEKKDEQLQQFSRILKATKTEYQKIHQENIELRNYILKERKKYEKRKQQLYRKQYDQQIEEQEESKNIEANENE